MDDSLPGDRPHFTLNPHANIALAGLWTTITVMIVVKSTPQPIALVFGGCVCGALIGFLQGRAIHSAPDTFLAAKSAMTVRKSLCATSAGKYAVRLLWASFIGLLILWGSVMFQPVLGFLAAYTALTAVREIFALPSLIWLRRRQNRL